MQTAYRDLMDGLREVVRITGNGGSVDVWVPSSQAYGSEGNAELGIKPNQLLNYKVDIVDIKYYNKKKQNTMKSNTYLSPMLYDCNVIIERGFEASNSANGGFNDYVEDEFKW